MIRAVGLWGDPSPSCILTPLLPGDQTAAQSFGLRGLNAQPV